MFTGIIKATSKVKKTFENKGILDVSIEAPKGWKAKLGESIALNGVCSTVSRKTAKEISFEYMPETLDKTNVGELSVGDVVNLETSLRLGDSLDGHFVTGHIDAVGKIVKIKKEGKSKVFSVSIPKELRKYIAYKGSVTIDGIALTISKKTAQGFEVSLIPYTLAHTNLDSRKEDDTVNIECDIIAKYLDAKRTTGKKNK
ncbi:MAG: riboflavin synthase [Candidatus Paceibacterota bacterium]|jgi:riboflavin synthase